MTRHELTNHSRGGGTFSWCHYSCLCKKIEGWRCFHLSGSDEPLSNNTSPKSKNPEKYKGSPWDGNDITFFCHNNEGGASVMSSTVSCFSPWGVYFWALTFIKKPAEFDWRWTEKQRIQQRKNRRVPLVIYDVFLLVWVFFSLRLNITWSWEKKSWGFVTISLCQSCEFPFWRYSERSR